MQRANRSCYYNVPFGGYSDDRVFSGAVSDVGPALVVMGSTVFSPAGVSTITDPSKFPNVFASSVVDDEGFKTAGATVGLLPADDLFVEDRSFLALAAL